MNKKVINVFDYAEKIMKEVENGVLLTGKFNDKVNTMSISWGSIGIEWNKKIFTAYVREGRYTREFLDNNPEFTVNIPMEKIDKKIISYCGLNSGRTTDKIKDLGLTLIEGEKIDVPAIKELPLTLECKIVYKQLQDKNAISDEIKKTTYPDDVESDNPLSNKDYHIAYYGEIVNAYIIEK